MSPKSDPALHPLAASGELRPDRAVLVSCLLFLVPIPLFYDRGEARLAAQLLPVTFASAMADAVRPCSVFWNHLDHFTAATTYFQVVYRHYALGSADPDGVCWSQLAVLVATSLAALEYTRCAPTFEKWRVRQCLWHVVCLFTLIIEAADTCLLPKLVAMAA